MVIFIMATLWKWTPVLTKIQKKDVVKKFWYSKEITGKHWLNLREDCMSQWYGQKPNKRFLQHQKPWETSI